MNCPPPGAKYDVGDVVELTCSVEYSGYTEPSLTWTDGHLKTLLADRSTMSTRHFNSCGGRDCYKRAIIRLGIDMLIANIVLCCGLVRVEHKNQARSR